MSIKHINTDLLNVTNENFDSVAIELFHLQRKHVPIYKDYIALLGIHIEEIKSISQIPFLPISFFKSHKVISDLLSKEDIMFESSGTSGQLNSKHFVSDVSLYEQSFMLGFEKFFGSVSDYCILGLLPSYLEKGNSSLVYMVNQLIEKSAQAQSGFYLQNHHDLSKVLQNLEAKKQKTLLFGVTYALLDFAERFSMKFETTNIIETGGMKGRREELTRSEVHHILKEAFQIPEIFSEYGMTELLSQAYSLGKEKFKTPTWMKVLVRDLNDPFEINKTGRGALNIIDLANKNSCAFIATDDIGEILNDESFMILGRREQSDLRGCGLMVAVD